MCVSTAPASSYLMSVPQEIMCTVSSTKKRRYPHIVVKHNYHDHAHDPEPEGFSYEEGQHSSSNTPFPIKLHQMLEGVEKEGLEDVVSWQPHGRCFVVHKPNQFKDLLPRYFKLSKIASFQRQLNLYGFTRLTAGSDRGGYYNELFLRGRPWLSTTIQRVKVKGTGVRARSNPQEEPDFWKMPWVESATLAPNTRVSRNISVVSEDNQSDDNQPLSSYDDETLLQPDRTFENPFAVHQGDDSDTILTGWGMPFHYMPHTETSTRDLNNTADDLLGDIDLDIFDHFDASNDKDFADLLDMIVS